MKNFAGITIIALYAWIITSCTSLESLASSISSSAGAVSSITPDTSGIPAHTWTKIIGSSAEDGIRAIVAPNNDAAYVAGFAYDSFLNVTNQGYEDVIVAKYSSNGSLLWLQSFGSPQGDSGLGICADSNDNIYVTGTTWSNLNGGTNKGQQDAVLMKIDSSGNLKWSVQYGTITADAGQKVVYSKGYVYVIGMTSWTMEGASNIGQQDAFLTKFDLNGNLIWNRLYGTTMIDGGYGITASPAGDIYITGFFRTNMGSTTNNYTYLIKVDEAGNTVWTKGYSPESTSSGTALASDASGIYMCGSPGAGFMGGTNGCFFTMKLDFDGNPLWTRVTGSTNGGRVWNIAVSPGGSVYTTGEYYPGAGGLNLYMVALVKHASDGTSLGLVTNDSPYNDGGYGVAVSPNGSVWVAGNTAGSLNGATKPTAQNSYDAFVSYFGK